MRILHIGLGPLGRMIVRDISQRHIGQLVGVVDRDPDLIGCSLAEVVDGTDPSIHIAPSLDQVGLSQPIDAAIVTTASDLAACAPTFRELLSHGISVVSTCEELLYPQLRHADLADELDLLAKENDSRLLGTGVNPGFLMDTLPAMVSAVCRGIERIDVWRIQDASNRRLPFQKKIGAGLTQDEFDRRAKAGVLRHVGLGESLHFIANAVGFSLTGWDESLHAVLAENEHQAAHGTIVPGSIAGVRQTARGWDATGTRVQLEFVAAVGQPDPHDRIRIQAEPPIDLVMRGGVHGDVATTAVTLNVLEPLLAARPGLHTMQTISIPSCRYHV